MYKRTRDHGVASYLRVIPDWVEQMKRAVGEADRRGTPSRLSMLLYMFSFANPAKL